MTLFSWPEIRVLLVYVSVGIVLLPLALSLLTIRKMTLSLVLCVLFTAGLSTEIFRLITGQVTVYTDLMLDLYSFLESAVFLWIIRHRTNGLKVTALGSILLLFPLPLWCTCYLISTCAQFVPLTQRELFNATYEILLSFYAGLELLKLVEDHKRLTSLPIFWILMGIFFYCFSTFFFMLFIQRFNITGRVWYIHNIINISIYILYSVGLWKSYVTIRSPNTNEITPKSYS